MQTIIKILTTLCLLTLICPLATKCQTKNVKNDSLTNVLIQKSDSVAACELKKFNESPEAKNYSEPFSLKDYKKEISIASDLGTDTYFITYYYNGSIKLPPGLGHFSISINSRTHKIEYFAGK